MRNVSIVPMLVASLLPLSAIRAQSTKLDGFVGKDLWKQQLSKKDRWRLQNIVGAVPKGELFEPQPWHVWKTNRNGNTRYVVLFGEPMLTIPGGSSACVQLFDAAAKRIKGWCFQTGWRIDLVNASIEYSDKLGSDLIILHTGPVINGQNVAKEYFAANDDRLLLVRLENDRGELVQNEFVFPNYEIGLAPTALTLDEWVRLLESKDDADVLSALTFLGGRHIDGRDRKFGPGPHESKYAELFQQLEGSPRVRDLIERLSKSENEWIKQAAALALRGPRDRLFQW